MEVVTLDIDDSPAAVRGNSAQAPNGYTCGEQCADDLEGTQQQQRACQLLRGPAPPGLGQGLSSSRVRVAGDLEGVALRQLCPGDEERARALCEECFPIRYPNSWYKYILSDKVYSRGAFSQAGGELVGMIVGEVHPLSAVEGETGCVLEETQQDTRAFYIISLGVLSKHRQKGLGSLLMHTLFSHVSQLQHCKIIYLHVLATNTAALEFYCRHGFQESLRIPGYYTIHKQPADGLLYLCLVNGGKDFSGSLQSYARRYLVEQLFSCSALSLLWSKALHWVCGE